jgi:hypothetical protein
VICLLSVTCAWPVAAGAGTLAGLWSIVLAARWFQRSNHAELPLPASIIVASGSGALLARALWWWFG